MYAACHAGSFEIVKMLVEAGAPIRTTTRVSMPVLFVAAYGGHEKIVEYLLRCGADVNEVCP
jgi:ankyrin repeat protein